MKDRLDKILFELGYFETKSKAQSSIMAGNVKINGEKITKAGYQFEYKEGTDIGDYMHDLGCRDIYDEYASVLICKLSFNM